MTDYVKREDVLAILASKNAAWDAFQKVKQLQAADVVEQKIGKWIRPTRVPDSMLDECSLCGFDIGAFSFNFCPNCGARMEEN